MGLGKEEHASGHPAFGFIPSLGRVSSRHHGKCWGASWDLQTRLCKGRLLRPCPAPCEGTSPWQDGGKRVFQETYPELFAAFGLFLAAILT